MTAPLSPEPSGEGAEADVNPAERARVPPLPSAPLRAATPSPLSDRPLYVNRELSLLQLQRRVLDEALDQTNPLL